MVMHTKYASARQLLNGLGRESAGRRSFALTKLLGDGNRLKRVELDGAAEREGGADTGGRCKAQGEEPGYWSESRHFNRR